ncbi:MAG: zinc-binding dehydrogenase [Bacillota bacterium]|nr:MAG: zinc-binding dehydrogenase [Bacillota bacterium]
MVLREYGSPLALEERPVPEPGPGEAVIRVRACGLCGTDLKIAAGKLPGTRVPVTMGHEPAGEVVAVGSGVRNVTVGDHVLAHFYVTCGLCEYCRTDRESICRNLLGRVGFEIDGGYADYLRLPATSFLRLAPGIGFEEGAILGDAVGTAFHALYRRGHLRPGETVLVMGVGGVGLHVVQVARALGARTVAVDLSPAKLELACAHGADHALRYGGHYVEQVRDALGGEGPHLIVETVGRPETVEANLRVLRPGGRLVIVGYLPGSTFRVDPLAALLDEVSVVGSRACTKDDLGSVMSLVSRGAVKPVITRRFPLEQVNEAFSELAADRILGRAVVVP